MMFSRAVISLAVFLFLAGSDVCAAQTFTILHSFPTSGVDGWNPTGLVRGPGDALYGTNGFGGPGKVGNVFKITAAGDYSVLHNFSGGADGSLPSAAPIIDLYGDIYGVTEYGGSANSGTIYKIDRNGNYEVLYNFLGGATGANPQTALVRDKAGNLYGATSNGGSSTCADSMVVELCSSSTALDNLLSFTASPGLRMPFLPHPVHWSRINSAISTA